MREIQKCSDGGGRVLCLGNEILIASARIKVGGKRLGKKRQMSIKRPADRGCRWCGQKGGSQKELAGQNFPTEQRSSPNALFA